MPDSKANASSLATLNAARSFNRRLMLKAGLGAGAAMAAGPWIVRDALSSSGELNILGWKNELPSDLLQNFAKASGIKIKTTPFSQNEEQINKLQATGGEGFDLCMPSFNRAPEFREIEVLAPFDMSKIDTSVLIPSMLEASTSLWTWDGKLHHLPHCWGSEAIAWRTDVAQFDGNSLSYGSLWDPQFKGKVQGRPHSMMLGLGLWLDATGKLPSNRMLDIYKDEATMRKIYDELLKFAVANKSQVKQFWDSSDNTKSGFIENGCAIGQVWDGPALSLKREGKPVNYMAPKEGAIAWVDGWSLTRTARNLPQVYEWMKFLMTPQSSALVAEGSGSNPVVIGAEPFLSEATRKNFVDAYPGDALKKLWRYPPSPPWFSQIRNEYAEKFKVARA